METDNPSFQELEQRVTDLVKARPVPARDSLVEAMSSAIMAEVARHDKPANHRDTGSYVRKWAGYFAVALVILAAGYQFLSNTDIQTPRSDFRAYSTAPGQRANITLGDGSIITLAPATKLRVSGRMVELNGEAFFTVNQASEPFIVRTDDAQVRVLGTKFGVRRYSGDVYASVSVVTGKVAVAANSASGSERVVTTGQTAQVANQSVAVVVSNPNSLAWLSGRMVFDDMLLPEVLRELERWYSVKFVIADATLANEIIHTEVGPESLDDAVRILSSALNARAVRNGSTVTFLRR